MSRSRLYAPLPSARQHPSYADCLEVNRECNQNCCLCWIMWHSVHSLQHTYVSSSCRSNRLGLSHWDPYAVHRGGWLELYYCNMVEWFWWDSSLILTTNWFPSVLWHCWFGHLACKNRPRTDLLCVEWYVKPYTLTHSLYGMELGLYGTSIHDKHEYAQRHLLTYLLHPFVCQFAVLRKSSPRLIFTKLSTVIDYSCVKYVLNFRVDPTENGCMLASFYFHYNIINRSIIQSSVYVVQQNSVS